MTTATYLVQQYEKMGHPLGRGIALDEARTLVEPLCGRLNVTVEQLDLSPNSLKLLDKLLIEYFASTNLTPVAPSGDDLVTLIREIASYAGLILVTHVNAQWQVLEKVNTLWTTQAVIGRRMDITQGVQPFVSPFQLVISLGNYAASAWDLISIGKEPGLYKMYQMAKRKLASQKR